MLRLQYCAKGEGRSTAPFFANDVRAQLAPLNRYGPNGLAEAVVSGLRTLTNVSRAAFRAASGFEHG